MDRLFFRIWNLNIIRKYENLQILFSASDEKMCYF